MSPARARARKGDGDRLRDEILDAASALLIETGSEDAVSIRAVADRVGVTPPSIYRHFDDKASLIFAVCEQQFAQFDEFIDAKTSGHVDPLESLVACGRAYVEFGLGHPEHYRIMFMGRSDLTPEQYDDVLGENTSFANLVASVEACVDAGLLERDPFRTAVMLWAGLHGITSLLISKPRFPWGDPDEIIEEMMSTMLSSLFTD